MALPPIPPDSKLRLRTERLVLEPVLESHAEGLWEVFKDPALHEYVPFQPQSLEKQRERCVKWAKRVSPPGDFVWLNWAVRLRRADEETRDAANDGAPYLGAFQADVDLERNSSIGYIVTRDAQGKGYATEGLRAIMELLREKFRARGVKAQTDTRNVASHRVLEKLGFREKKLLEGACEIRGVLCDDYFYELRWEK